MKPETQTKTPVGRPSRTPLALAFAVAFALALPACQEYAEGGATPDMLSANQAAEPTDAAPLAEAELMSRAELAPPSTPISQTLDPSNSAQNPTAARKVVYTGTMEVQVEEPDAIRAQMANYVRAVGGYVSAENQYSSRHISVTYRIPSAHFDTLVTRVSAAADFIVSRQISANDVTAEFVDIEARLKAKKEAEAQYLAIMRQAVKISDVLEVQNQLRVVREEIEQIEGRKRYLADQVSFSTLTVTYAKPGVEPINPEQGFWSRLGKGMGNGWKGIQEFVIGFITLWPLWLAVGATVFAVRRWLRKRKQNKA